MIQRTLFSMFGLAAGIAVTLGAGGVAPASAQDALPSKFANDPVAKAFGLTVFNGALKEGNVTWYGGTFLGRFLDKGGRKDFEERFGIKIEWVSGRLRSLTDRLRTEASVKKMVGDVFLANDQYQSELYKLNAHVKWRPPAPELNNMLPVAFSTDPEGYWWPVQLSTQSLIVNTDMVDPKEIKSYKDLINPKYKGKIGTRDPRAAGGGAWQMLHIANHPALGLDYIKKLYEVTAPIIYKGGTRQVRDSVIRGQYAISFGGRGSMVNKMPKGAKIAYVVPEEGITWTPSSIGVLNGSPHPNAAKLLVTWFYELPQLQRWHSSASPSVPHPGINSPIPEMGLKGYPIMKRIPDKQLHQPGPFFKDMEAIFGKR